MKPPKLSLGSLVFAAALTAVSVRTQAGTVTFAEYEGQVNGAAIPIDQLPVGLPDGMTASWTGFLLNTTAGGYADERLPE